MIANKKSPYIISEIGINHDGNFKKIIKLINLAKKSGADAVKFQIFKPSTLAHEKDKKKYKLFKKLKRETLFQMWTRLSVKKSWLKKIEEICLNLKIELGFSVFDIESLEMLNNIKYQFLKIASGDLNDHFLIKKIVNKKKFNILSTGMANKKEIIEACKLVPKKKLALLHCVSLYPAKPNETNLKRLEKLKKYSYNTGFSDHTIGVIASIKAITMGAKIIEKHFTYDHKADGPDHLLSANFSELKTICEFAKTHNNYLGTGSLRVTLRELKMKKFARKSIYAKKKISSGESYSQENIENRRPGIGIKSSEYEYFFRKKSKKNYQSGDLIEA